MVRRRLIAKLDDLLSKILTSWLRLSTNDPLAGVTILLLSSIIAFFTVYFIPSPLASQIVLLLAGVMFGTFLSGCHIATLLYKSSDIAKRLDINKNFTPDSLPNTGIQPVDEFVVTSMTKYQELASSTSTVTLEAEANNERYRVLTENLAAAIVIRDSLGVIVYCSPYIEVLTGYSLNEIYSEGSDFFLRIVHEEDRDKISRANQISSLGEPFQYQYRFLHKSGIEMWGETRTVPIIDDAGDFISSLSITLDVTATVRYQKQVEEKNAEIKDFTYMVSHDLKAPISTIKGMARIINDELQGKLSGDDKETLDHIVNASNRLETLVSSILEYSRASSQNITVGTVNLRDVLTDLKNDFSAQLEENKAELEIASDPPSVSGERLKIYQIFSNILGNAIKYRAPDRAPKIRFTFKESPNNRTATITVEDNGIGIPKDKLEVIFRPFQRVHGDIVEGTGIGLACVKKLVERFGGKVEVTSTEGVGSAFSITLPRSESEVGGSRDL